MSTSSLVFLPVRGASTSPLLENGLHSVTHFGRIECCGSGHVQLWRLGRSKALWLCPGCSVFGITLSGEADCCASSCPPERPTASVLGRTQAPVQQPVCSWSQLTTTAMTVTLEAEPSAPVQPQNNCSSLPAEACPQPHEKP